MSGRSWDAGHGAGSMTPGSSRSVDAPAHADANTHDRAARHRRSNLGRNNQQINRSTSACQAQTKTATARWRKIVLYIVVLGV